MPEVFRLVIDAVLGFGVLALIIWLIWCWRKMGPEFVFARMGILQRNTYWAVVFVAIAIVFILVSTGIEIWEQLNQAPWILDHEWLETVSLSSLLLGLLFFVPVVSARPHQVG